MKDLSTVVTTVTTEVRDEDVLDDMMRACFFCCRSEVFCRDEQPMTNAHQRRLLRHFVASYVASFTDPDTDLDTDRDTDVENLPDGMEFVLAIPSDANEREAFIEALIQLEDCSFIHFRYPEDGSDLDLCARDTVEVVFVANSVLETYELNKAFFGARPDLMV